MKIIDLLNKIANGEEVPNKIKYGDLVYNWTGSNYYNLTDTYLENHFCIEDLDQEVEVIEEEKPIGKLFEEVVRIKTELGLNFQEDSKEDNKKIEKLEYSVNLDEFNEENIETYIRSLICFINGLKEKTNEIIGVLNDKD